MSAIQGTGAFASAAVQAAFESVYTGLGISAGEIGTLQ